VTSSGSQFIKILQSTNQPTTVKPIGADTAWGYSHKMTTLEGSSRETMVT